MRFLNFCFDSKFKTFQQANIDNLFSAKTNTVLLKRIFFHINFWTKTASFVFSFDIHSSKFKVCVSTTRKTILWQVVSLFGLGFRPLMTGLFVCLSQVSPIIIYEFTLDAAKRAGPDLGFPCTWCRLWRVHRGFRLCYRTGRNTRRPRGTSWLASPGWQNHGRLHA